MPAIRRQSAFSVLVFLSALAISLVPLREAVAQPAIERIDGEIADVPYSILRPPQWNGDLVVLTHGSLAQLFELLAPGFLAGGYGVGWVNLPAVQSEGAALKTIPIATRQLQATFTARFGRPARTYLVGFSRGAHAMQRLVESAPVRYAAVLSFCGGNGGSQLQWDHFFTARVLFDYFFPGVLPGSATYIPDPPMGLPDYLGSPHNPGIAADVVAAILADPDAARAMASVSQFDLEYVDEPIITASSELVTAIVESLAIHSIGVNGLIETAGGVPFDNSAVYYSGSPDDVALNAGVARFGASPGARNYLATWYEPDGSIAGTPVLLVHTSRDAIAPERSNNDRYSALVDAAGGSDFLRRRVIDRAGHCAFGPGEIFTAFGDLVAWAELGLPPEA